MGAGPLIHQRCIFRWSVCRVQMTVNLANHCAILMPHLFRDGQMIVALHEFPGCEACRASYMAIF